MTNKEKKQDRDSLLVYSKKRFYNKIAAEKYDTLYNQYIEGSGYLIRCGTKHRSNALGHAESLIEINKKGRKYRGQISDVAKRKIKKIIFCWNEAIETFNQKNTNTPARLKRKLVFVTLTISDIQTKSDNWIKRNMLNRLLIHACRQWNVKQWIWIAESQQRGNIHFHIIFDNYVNMLELQKQWNRIQSDNKTNEAYMREFSCKQAPSTHIRSVQSGQVAKYLTKYITKVTSSARAIEGRLWGCSDSLRELKTYSCDAIPLYDDYVCCAIENGEASVISAEHYDIIVPLDMQKFLKSFPEVPIYRQKYYLKIYELLYECT